MKSRGKHRVSKCPPPCDHDRLLHDIWGCKICRGRCGISIVYLTTKMFSRSEDKAKATEAIELGKALDRELDRKDEHRIKVALQRAQEERDAA